MNIGKMKFATFNSDGERRRSVFDKIFTRLFGRWLEYPDVELTFKIPRILRKEKGVDLLITIAIPYAIHWGSALTKDFYTSGFPKTWVADCGDPFMGNHFHKKPFYFKYIEKWFCRRADFITIPIESARDAIS